MYVIYGDVSFQNQSRRNAVRTKIVNELEARGFTPREFGDYAAGAVNVGTTGLRLCYSHTDVAQVEAVELIAVQALGSNQYDGDFGWQDLGLVG